MKHRARVSHFGRKSGPRKALVRGLVNSLVEHGRIKTTLAKAKELRRHVERAVTMGIRGLEDGKALHVQRLLFSRFPNEHTVSTLMKDLAPRFKSRPGGYTRILKLGLRPGDKAEMALIQFVDYKAGSPDVADEKATVATKEVKKVAKVAELRKKRVRKLQRDARRVARA